MGFFGANWVNIISGVSGALFAVVFFFSACEIIKASDRIYDKAFSALSGLTLYEIGVCCIGIVAGLAVSYFITIPLATLRWVGRPLTIFINCLLAFLGFSLAFWKKQDISGTRGKWKGFGNGPKLLDTSVIIDGRISEILRTGFIEGELIVPEFVLVELRRIADSADSLRRSKGRRGLDILNYIQKELGFQVKIEKCELPPGAEVDTELVNLAKKNRYDILTTDFNLNKVASFQGVRVLNVNELNNAIKPIAMPGEEMIVEVIKDGKEAGQGVGYLPDGTMIVVEGGKSHIGVSIPVVLTSVLQTAAGRMIFAKPAIGSNAGNNNHNGQAGQSGGQGNNGQAGQNGGQGNNGATNNNGQAGQNGYINNGGNAGQSGQSNNDGHTGQNGAPGNNGDTNNNGQADKNGYINNDGNAGQSGAPGNNGDTNNNGQADKSGHINNDGNAGQSGQSNNNEKDDQVAVSVWTKRAQ